MLSHDDIKRLCEGIAERGNLVEAAWASFRLRVILPGFDEADVDLMRLVFYGGATWMFSDLITGLQQTGCTPPEALFGHIRQINRELGDYVDDIECSHGIRRT